MFEANEKADPRVLAWQYRDNPFGVPSSWVAEDDGRLVAHAGVFPVPGRLDGREVVLGHSADAAVAPSHRRRGLFQRLADARFRDAAAWAALTMSFPNPSAVPANRRAGLRRIARVRAHVRPAFGSVGAPRGEEVDELPPDVDGLWRRAGGDRDGVRRGAAWWRWRYLSHPLRPYRVYASSTHGTLDGLLAVRPATVRGIPLLHVMDLLADDVAAARGLLAAAVTRGDAAALVALGLPGQRWSRLGLLPLPHVMDPRPMILGVVDGTEPAGRYRRARWQVSWGDHDHL